MKITKTRKENKYDTATDSDGESIYPLYKYDPKYSDKKCAMLKIGRRKN